MLLLGSPQNVVVLPTPGYVRDSSKASRRIDGHAVVDPFC